ncbi:hypothetical protein M413DRAFT_129406 [Hebeloma cylindrosporum]|uniref:Uncharacterized protein n=1 Tax=Hebeloma cylindrosporum TaxID=76867 RepID=A0A0C3CDB9_HEBCY|nr:hypothetical protein M413DRAFT_129406 [Hebeloma cylindrosporum h7]
MPSSHQFVGAISLGVIAGDFFSIADSTQTSQPRPHPSICGQSSQRDASDYHRVESLFEFFFSFSLHRFWKLHEYNKE